MSIRVFAALLLVAAIGLSACGKSEESAQGQAASQTGGAQQEKADKPAGGAPEQPTAPKGQ